MARNYDRSAEHRPSSHYSYTLDLGASAPRTNRRVSENSATILDFDRLSTRYQAARGAEPQSRSVRSSAQRPSAATRPSVHAEARRRRPAPESVRPAVERAEANDSTRKADLKRTLRRRKADRLFSRQEPDAADINDQAPRPGLYKGEMGRSQRKSARMQEANAHTGVSFALPVGFSQSWSSAPRAMRVIVLAFFCVILSCAFVYPSAKDAYGAVRDQQQAQAEYQAIQDRNAEIQNRSDLLKTDDGMANYARDEYGYVKKGETSVLVSGLDKCNIAADAENQTAAIASSSIKPPDTWYSPFLDTLFGYPSTSLTS